METLANINFGLGILLFICYGYQIFYVFVPFFRKHRRHKIPIKRNRLAVLISARNEEAVIGNLLPVPFILIFIPTLPPAGAKGVGSNAYSNENPFVIPATDEGRATMGQPVASNNDESDENDSKKKDDKEIPIAPIISIEQDEKPTPEAPAPQPSRAPEVKSDNPISADSELEVSYLRRRINVKRRNTAINEGKIHLDNRTIRILR